MNPTLCFKDRVVAVALARRSSSASRRSPAPRPATSRTPSPPMPRPPASTPTSSFPPTSRRGSCSRRRLRDRAGRRPGQLRRGQPALLEIARTAAGDSSTSTSGPSTPRAPNRSPLRPSSSSAGACRTRSSRRSPRAPCSPRSAAASRSDRPRPRRRACCPASTAPRRRAATRSRRRSARPRDLPAREADRSPRAFDRQPGRRSLRTRARAQDRRLGQAVSDDEIRTGIRLLAETTGIFTETAGGVTTATLAKLAEAGELDVGGSRRRLHHGRGPEDARRRPRRLLHARDRALPGVVRVARSKRGSRPRPPSPGPRR